MKRHLLCLTVDTDPDGLSGKVTNRQTLKWEGLQQLKRLPDELGERGNPGSIPVTWFVRADGQIESILGSAGHLLETHAEFWSRVSKCGHEIAWHPHLYRQAKPQDTAVLITDPREANEELVRLWEKLTTTFQPTAFRNGEGWHSPETYATVERLGLRCDSTAIPGRTGADGHPMNWEGSPNQPYFPQSNNLRAAGPKRALLELPMNTWLLKAPHDPAPRLRYMNPAVHPGLFASALQSWENACTALPNDLYVWVMIFHPDEVLETGESDALYSRSVHGLSLNLEAIANSLRRLEHDFEWVTVSQAAERWRAHQQQDVNR